MGKPIERLRLQAAFVAHRQSDRLEAMDGSTDSIQVKDGDRPVDDPPLLAETTDAPEEQDISLPDSSTADESPRPSRNLEPAYDQPLTLPRPRLAIATQVFQGMRLLGMPLVWLIVLAFSGGTGVSAIFWLTTLPPLPNCNRLHLFSTDNDRLYCVEQAAKSGRAEAMVAGLRLIQPWPANHPLHNRVQYLQREWSQSLLAVAKNKADQDELGEAIELAKAIPDSSPSYKAAQSAIAVWQNDSRRAKQISDAVQAALKQQDWKAADTQLEALSNLKGDYWQQRFQRLKQQAITEQLARRQIQQIRAQSAAAIGNADALGQLIAIADQIPTTSFARPDAEAELKRLVQALMTVMNEQIARADLAGATATVELLPQSVPPPIAAQDALWLGQALPLAQQTLPTQPLAQLGQISWVLPHLQLLKPAPPIAAQAKSLITKLTLQQQNLSQLQVAATLAQLHQIPTLRLAIQLAQAIAPGQPHRLYAQTLIAQWRRELEAAEDRSLLIQAQQLAKVNKVPYLQAAIATAKQIALGRPLRLEAQTTIADWNQKLQTLADQPLLTQAQNLAKRSKFADAINTANKIAIGRTLYPQAQSAIQTWTKQLQAADDRLTLDKAHRLAKQGQLDSAIALAEQIAPERSLYLEAQAAIAQWQQQAAELEPNQVNGGAAQTP